MISIYRPESKSKVYCNKCWWGDGWDASDYRMEIDFSKPFLTQFFELFQKVPAPITASKELQQDYTCEGVITKVVLGVVQNDNPIEANDPNNQTVYNL